MHTTIYILEGDEEKDPVAAAEADLVIRIESRYTGNAEYRTKTVQTPAKIEKSRYTMSAKAAVLRNRGQGIG